ncbi:hypothetical protein PENSUB_2266 [Penicillium subrubescens]|uniref:Uncharacterized protein n=1 Tax=Penicillium subrubescens TaxID=1316194 RepID=A0A1Q5UIA1_9EURO|nr:hypothetical protein PENSUB_2266 [Penicillium subrubescens]
MAVLITHPVGAPKERSEVANPPSYHGVTISNALPVANQERTGLLKNNTFSMKDIVISRQAGIPKTAQYSGL